MSSENHGSAFPVAEEELGERRGATLARTISRRRYSIAIVAVVVTVVALGLSLTQRKQYTATATLLFQNANFSQGLLGTNSALANVQGTQDPTREAATNLALVQQGIIAQQTARALKGGLTRSRVEEYVSVAAAGQSDLVNVAATTYSPSFSARVANSYSAQFIAYRKQADSAAILSAERDVASRIAQLSTQKKNSAAGRELAARQQDLNILASLQTGNAQLSEPATPPASPSSPKPVRNALIGIFVGIIFGLFVAVVRERIDRRVRDPAELESIFGRPVLGLVPRSRQLAAQRTDASAALQAADAEPFRLIRANLRYLNVDREIRTVVVSSSAPQEGKSTVAYNLALVSASSSGRRVVLIEADLRRPVLGRMTGKREGQPGLSDVLAGRADLRDALQHLPISMRTTSDEAVGDESGGGRGLDVIAAGATPPNPADLLESRRMSELVTYLRSEYDLVIIDTPPISAVSDAVHLLGQVDGVLFIARQGVTTRDLAETSARQLARVGAPVLGIVINGAREEAGYSGYTTYQYESSESAGVVLGPMAGAG